MGLMGGDVRCCGAKPSFFFLFFLLLFMLGVFGDGGMVKGVSALACNWGTMATHPLPPTTVVKLMNDNGLDKVKLFEADDAALKALGKSGVQVMLGIPNSQLASLAGNATAADRWVQQNVSQYISKHGTDIRYVAVGNEPFLKEYNDMYTDATLPALQNVQAALNRAGLRVKATVPFNADVYDSPSGIPSGGDFRSDVFTLTVSIVRFLHENKAPITINIYPFLSLQSDPHFPKDFAFFPNSSSPPSMPVVDGSVTYTNVFDANFDILVAALAKNDFNTDEIEIIVGEVGWPTDGGPEATPANAQRFNQGLLDRIIARKGTPRRATPPDIYVFSLIDEDNKSLGPGNFERHWGIFNSDGSVKYPLNLGKVKSLVPAKGVKYLERKWCVLSPRASEKEPSLAQSVSYACQNSDCTRLAPGSSCGGLDLRGNASYAFNMYFQAMNQRPDACNFTNLAVITGVDPSTPTCKFEIQIDTRPSETDTRQSTAAATRNTTQKSDVIQVAVSRFLMTLLTYVSMNCVLKI